MGTCHQPHLYVVIITEHQSWTPRDTGDAHTGRCNVNPNRRGGCPSRNEEKLGQEIGMFLSLSFSLGIGVRPFAIVLPIFMKCTCVWRFLHWRLYPMSIFDRFACKHLFHSAKITYSNVHALTNREWIRSNSDKAFVNSFFCSSNCYTVFQNDTVLHSSKPWLVLELIQASCCRS